MKYFSIKTVVESYLGFQNCMTNKSWGYLALLKGCNNSVLPSVTYEVGLDIVSNFLEDIFNLSQNKKQYESGRSLFVVFSKKWDKYFNEQGRYSPNIYDVVTWAYRRKTFSDNVTFADILTLFSNEFNIPYNIISSSFDVQPKAIEFSNSLYSESELKTELRNNGVNVSTNNIDAKKGSVVASPGEISRGPFVQTLYAGLDITEYVLILQSNYDILYKNELEKKNLTNNTSKETSMYRKYITAIKSKPFLLLAGISGTGKSRIVRELARACWEPDSEEYDSQKPSNFEMVQVKPNWHDSSELIGYVSRIDGEKFVAGEFLKFIAKAWENLDTPYFLCLDEMNLAPVEQYFAEYLSVVESRKADENGNVTTDPILKSKEQWFFDLTAKLTQDEDVRQRFNSEGISIPQNLIVVGTVNMDETTFSFSRKVLDRAMTIEMNKVDLMGGLESKFEPIGKLSSQDLIGTAVEGVDVYEGNRANCDTVISYLKAINDRLEGTPFKVAYRTRNEFLLYVVNNLPYNKDDEGKEIGSELVIARALDEITSMKVLSRIEGDESKVTKGFLEGLEQTIKEQLKAVATEYNFIAEAVQEENKEDEEGKTNIQSISLAKLAEMKKRLVNSGYTSFWA